MRPLLKSTHYAAPKATHQPLHRDTWRHVNRALVAKMLGEFAHEQLLTPHPRTTGPEGSYECRGDTPEVRYTFQARRFELDHWAVDPNSILRHADGKGDWPRAIDCILDFRAALNIPDHLLDTYLEEVSNTLYSNGYKWENQRFDAHELASAGLQDIEASMTEGHPCFVANGGRIGFNCDEFLAYAPETGGTLQLQWVAASRQFAHFAAAPGIDHWAFMGQELGQDRVDAYRSRIRGEGQDPDDYILIPIHPWQWKNRLAIGFAGELAEGRLIPLGEGNDDYRPQQSIRTLFNQSTPHRPYVKVSLSILNMGFMRGLSPAYMATTPAISQWVADMIEGDPFLKARGFAILSEFATVGYRHPGYERSAVLGSAHGKMLSALWRQSPIPMVQAGESLATMASLLHRDNEGKALVSSLIKGSGLSTPQWTHHYLQAYLVPLIHTFFAHQFAFMPHGENVILVLENHRIKRVILKDIGEEVTLFDTTKALPPKVQRIQVELSDSDRCLYIFTDIFDSFFRFLSPILSEEADFEESTFWGLVAQSIREYQSAFPQFHSQFKRFNLFVDRFERLCLNRLQLRNHTQLLDLKDPVSSFQMAGTLSNPLAHCPPKLEEGR